MEGLPVVDGGCGVAAGSTEQAPTSLNRCQPAPSGNVTPVVTPVVPTVLTSAAVGATTERRDDLVDRAGDRGQLPVVDEPAVDLPGEFAQHVNPLAVPWSCCLRWGSGGDNDPLDDLDGRTA